MDHARLHLDIMRLKKIKRNPALVEKQYNSGWWNRDYDSIDFENLFGNFVNDQAERMMTRNGKIFWGERRKFVNEYYSQIFNILEECKCNDVVELGCGLGHMLFQIRKRYDWNLSGYDISDNAVSMLQRYSTEKNYNITFGVHDLNTPFTDELKGKIVFTHVCLEQTKHTMSNVIKNIAQGRPKLLINFEVDYKKEPYLVRSFVDAHDYQNNLIENLEKHMRIISRKKLPLSLSPTTRLSCIISESLSSTR